MKLHGKIFENAMEFNEINFKENVISIHNTDNNDIGILRKIKSSEKLTNGTIVLGKRDYSLLSKLQEFDLTFSETKIRIKASNLCATIANLVEVNMIDPQFKDLIELPADVSEFMKAIPFAAGTKAQPQFGGLTLQDKKIVTTDGSCIYVAKVESEFPIAINIPKEALKHLDQNKTYKLLTNGRIAVFKSGGFALYTKLIEIKVNPSNLADDWPVSFKLRKEDAVKELSLIKNYTDIVRLQASGKQLHLIAESEESNFDITVDIVPEKLVNLDVCFMIDKLIKVLDISKDNANVFVRKNMLCNKQENESAFVARYNSEKWEVK